MMIQPYTMPEGWIFGRSRVVKLQSKSLGPVKHKHDEEII
jgi:hypothetical protein